MSVDGSSATGPTATKYGDHTLDFWTQFADSAGPIESMWDSGDGIHMNDDAHAELSQIVVDAQLPEAVIDARP